MIERDSSLSNVASMSVTVPSAFVVGFLELGLPLGRYLAAETKTSKPWYRKVTASPRLLGRVVRAKRAGRLLLAVRAGGDGLRRFFTAGIRNLRVSSGSTSWVRAW
jgi:hypothetical protein